MKSITTSNEGNNGNISKIADTLLEVSYSVQHHIFNTISITYLHALKICMQQCNSLVSACYRLSPARSPDKLLEGFDLLDHVFVLPVFRLPVHVFR